VRSSQDYFMNFDEAKKSRALTKGYREKRARQKLLDEEDRKLIATQFEMNSQIVQLEARVKTLETEARQSKVQQTHYAVEYFKVKSSDVLDIFNAEQMFMVHRFYELKKKAVEQDTKIDKMARRMVK
jgi:hypothetical protein